MLNFDFLKKGLGIIYPPHFVFNFSATYISCYILLTDLISLPDCFYFTRYWSICVLIVFSLDCDVINFEINLIFLIKPFFLHDRQKSKYLDNEKIF